MDFRRWGEARFVCSRVVCCSEPTGWSPLVVDFDLFSRGDVAHRHLGDSSSVLPQQDHYAGASTSPLYTSLSHQVPRCPTKRLVVIGLTGGLTHPPPAAHAPCGRFLEQPASTSTPPFITLWWHLRRMSDCSSSSKLPRRLLRGTSLHRSSTHCARAANDRRPTSRMGRRVC